MPPYTTETEEDDGGNVFYDVLNVLSSPAKLGLAGSFSFLRGLTTGATDLFTGIPEYGVRKLFGHDAAEALPTQEIREFVREDVGEDFLGGAERRLVHDAVLPNLEPAEESYETTSEILGIGGNIGSALIPLGIGLKGVSYATRAIENPVVRYGIQYGTTAVMATLGEAASVANRAYNEIFKQTNDRDEADVISAITFWDNAKLLGVTNLFELPLIFGGAGKIARSISRGVGLIDGSRKAVTSRGAEAAKGALSYVGGIGVESGTEVLQTQIDERARQNLRTSFSDFGNKLANLTDEDKELALKVFAGGLAFGGIAGPVSVNYGVDTANGKEVDTLVKKIDEVGERSGKEPIELPTENRAERGATVLDAFTGATLLKNPENNEFATLNALLSRVKERGIGGLFNRTGQTETFKDTNNNTITLKLPSPAEIRSFLERTAVKANPVIPFRSAAPVGLATGGLDAVAGADLGAIPEAGAALAGAAASKGRGRSKIPEPERRFTDEEAARNIERSIPQLSKIKPEEMRKLYENREGLREVLESPEGKPTTAALKSIGDAFMNSMTKANRERLQNDLRKRKKSFSYLIGVNNQKDRTFAGRRATEAREIVDAIMQLKPSAKNRLFQYASQFSEDIDFSPASAEKFVKSRGLVIEGAETKKVKRERERRSFFTTTLGKAVSQFNQQLRALAPKVWGGAERMELDIHKGDQLYLENKEKTGLWQQFEAMIKEQNFTPEQEATFYYYWNLNQRPEVKKILNDDPRIQAVFDSLDATADRAKALGINLPFTVGWLPRSMTNKNYERFLSEYKINLPKYKARAEVASEQLGIPLTKQMELDLAKVAWKNEHLELFAKSKLTRSSDRIQARSILVPDPDMVHYYSSPSDALRRYFYRMNRMLSTAEFLQDQGSLALIGQPIKPYSAKEFRKQQKIEEAERIKAVKRGEGDIFDAFMSNEEAIMLGKAPEMTKREQNRLLSDLNKYDVMEDVFQMQESGGTGFDTTQTLPVGIDFAKSAGLLARKIRMEHPEISDADIDHFNKWFGEYLQRKVTNKLTTTIQNIAYLTTLGGARDLISVAFETGQIGVEYGVGNTVKGITRRGKGTPADINRYLDTSAHREARAGEDYYLKKQEQVSAAALAGFIWMTNQIDQANSTATYERLRNDILKDRVSTARQAELDGLFTKKEQAQLKEDLKERRESDLVDLTLSALGNKFMGHNLLAKSYLYHKHNGVLRLPFTLKSYYLTNILGRIGEQVRIARNPKSTKGEKLRAQFLIAGIVSVFIAEDRMRDLMARLLRGTIDEITVEDMLVETGFGLFGTNRYSATSLQYEFVGGALKFIAVPLSLGEAWGEALLKLFFKGDPEQITKRVIRTIPYLGDTAGELLINELFKDEKGFSVPPARRRGGSTDGFGSFGDDFGSFDSGFGSFDDGFGSFDDGFGSF